jgi:hypothetical protein
MLRTPITVSALLSFAFVFLVGPGQPLAASKQVVTATAVKQAPAGLDDPAWAQVSGVEVPMEGKERFVGKKFPAAVKVAYTADTIHWLFSWPDATKSVTKGAWQYDGKAWTRLKGDEDRISVLFEITRIEGFASKGCTVACHVPPGKPTKDGLFGTKNAAEKGDLWHWKAVRSAPYDHADDTWLTAITEKTGRKNDAGKGGDFTNMTPDKARPLLMQDPAKPASVPGALLREEAVPIADYSVFKAGDVVPYRLPQKPDGSRGDVKAVSRYENGRWTVMLSRKLNTGQDDDVAFDPRREYSFALAIFDDSGDEHSYDSETLLTLRFAR